MTVFLGALILETKTWRHSELVSESINQYPQKMKQGYVYILTNKPRGTLYIGVTSQLIQRTYIHKEKIIPGFSKRYGLDRLVYFEYFDSMENAISR